MNQSCVLLVFFYLCIVCYGKKIIRTVVGIPPYGGDYKLATSAFLNNPQDVFVSPTSREVFIADTNNHMIRKVDKYGIISTVAGVPGISGYFGDNNTATDALLSSPSSVFVQYNSEILFADSFNHAVRKVALDGNIYTIAGGNQAGASGDGGLGINAQLNYPNCAFEWKNEVYICDTYNNAIRKLFQNGTITTIAGKLNQVGYSGDGESADNALLNSPVDVYVTAENEQLIADLNNNAIRKVFRNGTIITLISASASALYVSPKDNSIYFADRLNCTIHKILSNDIILTVAGVKGLCGYYLCESSIFNINLLNSPSGMFIDSNEDIFVTDTVNNIINRVNNNNNNIEQFAGKCASSNDPDMLLRTPTSVYVTKTNVMLISDSENHVVKRVSNDGYSISITAGELGQARTNNSRCLNTTNCMLRFPNSAIVNEDNQDIFIADEDSILQIDSTTNMISTIFVASSFMPKSICITSSNELYIADSSHVIRKGFLNNSTMIIIAGVLGTSGYAGDCGGAIYAKLNSPVSVAVSEKTGEVYFADSNNNAVRKIFTNGTITTVILLQQNITSVTLDKDDQLLFSTNNVIYKLYLNQSIEIIAGDPFKFGYSGEDKNAASAILSATSGLFASKSGALYAVDRNYNVVFKIANLCINYSVNIQIPDKLEASSIVTNERICNDNEDFFFADYLPVMEAKFKSTNAPIIASTMNWGENNLYYYILSSILDVIIIEVNLCNTRFKDDKNCTAVFEWGSFPDPTYQLFPCLTSIIVQTGFKQYPTVDSLLVQFEIFDYNYRKSLQEKYVVDSQNVTITGLEHSSEYSIRCNVIVTYSNGLILSPSYFDHCGTVKTLIGVFPGEIQDFTIQTATIEKLVLTWNISVDQQGFPSAHQLQLEWTSINSDHISNSNYGVEIIEYNATQNTPNSYAYDLVVNQIYTFRLRACNEIGCGNYTIYQSHTVQGSSLSSLATAIIISVVVFTTLMIFLIVIIVFILIILLAILKKLSNSKRKQQNINYQQMHIELEEIREFQIDESKLDLNNSILLGSGASGTVFTAKYFNMDVAVKLVSTTTISGVENDLSDFYNELQFLNHNAGHNNIIRYFGVYNSKDKNQIGLVMEYCCNGDVSTYVSKHSNLTITRKISLIEGIANGMSYLHHHNIAHRDLKCENVLLDMELVPKIIDFGYSKEISEEANKSLNLTMNVSTAAYCAPEVIKSMVAPIQTLDHKNSQASNSGKGNSLTEPLLSNSSDESSVNNTHAYNKKCDVYSFGIVIYVIYFQRKNPYGNVSDNQILYQLSKNPEVRPKIPTEIVEEDKWLIELMKQCWDSNPHNRPSFEQICLVIRQNRI